MPKRETKARLDAYEAIFTALAHPARRRVLMAVFFEGGEMSAGAIAKMFEHAWQTTTRHLQVLEAAKLLTAERQGRMRIYRLNKKRLELVKDWLSSFFTEEEHTCQPKRKRRMSHSFSD